MPADPTPDLAALDGLFAAATPGPLSVCENHDGDGWDVFSLKAGTVAYAMSPADAALIAALHNAWPELRRRLEIGDAAVESLRDIQAECDRCLIVQGVPQAETPTTHGYGKIRDIAARSRLRALREQSDAA